jgi:murein DD-endopeptidase MepM/ murein hydrolase activator NlpD
MRKRGIKDHLEFVLVCILVVLAYPFKGWKRHEQTRAKAFTLQPKWLLENKIEASFIAMVLVLVLVGGITLKQTIASEPTAELTAAAAPVVEQTEEAPEAASVKQAAVDAPATVARPEVNVALEEVAPVTVPAYSLTVNGREMAYFRRRKDAEEILDRLKAKYTPEDEKIEITGIDFSEDVEIAEERIDAAAFEGYDDPEEVFAYIVKGTKEEKIHTIQSGENFWVISENYGLSVDDLIRANPDVVPERIQIGQEISLIVPRPLINVRTKERQHYEERIPFEVVYEDNSNMYKEEYRTKVQGTYGESAIVADVVKENGIELGRLVVSEETVKDPSAKVVYRGTKDPPPRIGTGTFSRPTSRGYITSPFGERWGRRHEGVDIGLPMNTAIRAADGGVVVETGYDRYGYGYYVKIDHGANMMTLYAHNNKILVTRGQKVFKGEQIALSGNTGRSTGPHLHFEVRKNGVPVNPLKYVNY